MERLRRDRNCSITPLFLLQLLSPMQSTVGHVINAISVLKAVFWYIQARDIQKDGPRRDFGTHSKEDEACADVTGSRFPKSWRRARLECKSATDYDCNDIS